MLLVLSCRPSLTSVPGTEGLARLQGLCRLCSQPSSLPFPFSTPNRSAGWGGLALR